MRRRSLPLVLALLALLAGALRERPRAVASEARARIAARPSRPATPDRRPTVAEPGPAAADTSAPEVTDHLFVVVRPTRRGLNVLPRETTLDPWSVPEADDPELARLLEMREEALLAWEDEVAEAQAELPPGEAVAPRDLAAPPDLREVAGRLRQLGADRADEPRVEEFARLMLADARFTLDGPGPGPSADAAELVREADPDLAAQAAVLLAHAVRRDPLDLPTLEALEALGDEIELDPDVVSFGLDQALRFHPDHARTWAGRLRRVVEDCDVDAPRCLGDESALGDAVAMLGEEPSDWRQSARAAAFRCWPDADLTERTVTASWDGGWSFEGWAPAEDAFSACFAAALPDGPDPDAPVVVRIEVHGDP